jgi:phage replication-related protein YjqB (UPF0714/DUF867 family)
VREVPESRIAIIAPHAGGIERGTTRIARQLAGDEHSLYLFEGLKPSGNFDALHITSCRFDEPSCIDLICRTDIVITVHGCVGLDERVYIGGLHDALKQRIAAALQAIDVDAPVNGHSFPATDPENICNRGRLGAGVQLEFSVGIRRRMQYGTLAYAIRSAFTGIA